MKLNLGKGNLFASGLWVAPLLFDFIAYKMTTLLHVDLNGKEGNLEPCFNECNRGIWTRLRKLEKGKRKKKTKGWTVVSGQDAEECIILKSDSYF